MHGHCIYSLKVPNFTIHSYCKKHNKTIVVYEEHCKDFIKREVDKDETNN